MVARWERDFPSIGDRFLDSDDFPANDLSIEKMRAERSFYMLQGTNARTSKYTPTPLYHTQIILPMGDSGQNLIAKAVFMDGKFVDPIEKNKSKFQENVARKLSDTPYLILRWTACQRELW